VKKIVITGATSFIGVNLIRTWLQEDCKIYAVIRPNSKNSSRVPNDEKVVIIERNMGQYERLSEDIDHADYFYHLAWEGARLPYRDDKEIQKNNYECTIKAFDAAAKLGCSFFLGTGSQAEYGKTDGLVDEMYPCHPTTEYGKEKLHACQYLSQRASDYSMKFIWTRIFSIYGLYDYPGTLIMSAIEKMKNNEPVEMTECTQLWDYLNVADAARALKLFALTECESGIYNIASGEYQQLKQFVESIKLVLNSKSELNFGAVPYGEKGPVNLTPNVEKIKQALGWTPEIDFEKGIRDIIQGQTYEKD
jgi:nucleoside-diphosphate-sugar epimerase